MTSEVPFRVAFVGLLVVLAVLRVYWHRKARIFRDGDRNVSEGRAMFWARLVLLPVWLGLIGGWLVVPDAMSWSQLPVPDALRWAGVPIVLAGLALLAWVHVELGRNFSPFLRIRTDQTLVTTGPYRWVRHPMYTSFLILYVGFGLLSANTLILVTAALLIVAVRIRTWREETMLEETFGADWRAWRNRTGALLPRLWVRRAA